MAKNVGLWDDSALVKALDDGISKYKIMHGKGGEDGSIKKEKITEAKSPRVETDDNTTNFLKNTTPTGEAGNSSVTKNCPSEVVEQHTSLSKGDQVQATDCTYVNAGSTEDYYLLLDQYNAVEEQRRKLLEQLYQYGNWDYQGYAYGAGYDSQYYPLPAPQPSGPPVCTCRPYVCPYSTAPCTSLAAVSSCETGVGGTAFAYNGSSVSLDDGGLIKAAMGAVDRAIRSFSTETSCMPEADKERAQEKTSQMDLSVVLNAWFSAGFYTGKYLSEQASAKK